MGDLLRVCIPHSEAAFRVVADYIRSLAPDTTFDSVVRECHVKRALDYLSEGQAEIAIVRFRGSMRTISGKKPRLWDFPCRSWSTIRDSMVVHESHPLANRANVTKQGDQAMYRLSIRTGISCPISRTGAGAFTRGPAGPAGILSTLPNTYLWSAPIPADLLERYHLRQIPVRTSPIPIAMPLVYHPMHRANALETGLLQKIRTEYPKYFEG